MFIPVKAVLYPMCIDLRVKNSFFFFLYHKYISKHSSYLYVHATRRCVLYLMYAIQDMRGRCVFSFVNCVVQWYKKQRLNSDGRTYSLT